MKRIVSTVTVAITAVVLSATLVLAADPVPNDQGVRISAIAQAVDFVSGYAHGKAVSAAAKLHGQAIAAANRLKLHGANANAGGKGKGQGQGASAGQNDPAAEPGESAGNNGKGPKNKETGRLKGAAASEAGKVKSSNSPNADPSHSPNPGQSHNPNANPTPSE
jgi:hypothetical protein